MAAQDEILALVPVLATVGAATFLLSKVTDTSRKKGKKNNGFFS